MLMLVLMGQHVDLMKLTEQEVKRCTWLTANLCSLALSDECAIGCGVEFRLSALV